MFRTSDANGPLDRPHDLTGYVCRDEVQSGVLQQVLPGWAAGGSTLTALMPYRQGLLPSVRTFVEHLAAEFPKAVRI
jgi:hypothetical protein